MLNVLKHKKSNISRVPSKLRSLYGHKCSSFGDKSLKAEGRLLAPEEIMTTSEAVIAMVTNGKIT